MNLQELSNLNWYHTLCLKKVGGGFEIIFDRNKADYIFEGDWCFNTESRKIIAQITDVVKGCSMLDAGTYDGFFAHLFHLAGAKVSSLDVSNHASRRELMNFAGIKDDFLHLNIYNLDTLGRKFDFVWCQDVICHLDSPLLAVKRLREICTKKIFLGVDRFTCSPIRDVHFFTEDFGLVDINKDNNINMVARPGNSDYVFAYPKSAIKQMLIHCGFKNPKLKFSVRAEGGKIYKTVKKRVVDIYEADIDPSYIFDPIKHDLSYIITAK